MSQKGSGVTLNCVPWFVFSFAFAGWLGLGFVPGLSRPRSQESRMKRPLSMTNMEFSLCHPRWVKGEVISSSDEV